MAFLDDQILSFRQFFGGRNLHIEAVRLIKIVQFFSFRRGHPGIRRTIRQHIRTVFIPSRVSLIILKDFPDLQISACNMDAGYNIRFCDDSLCFLVLIDQICVILYLCLLALVAAVNRFCLVRRCVTQRRLQLLDIILPEGQILIKYRRAILVCHGRRDQRVRRDQETALFIRDIFKCQVYMTIIRRRRIRVLHDLTEYVFRIVQSVHGAFQRLPAFHILLNRFQGDLLAFVFPDTGHPGKTYFLILRGDFKLLDLRVADKSFSCHRFLYVVPANIQVGQVCISGGIGGDLRHLPVLAPYKIVGYVHPVFFQQFFV